MRRLAAVLALGLMFAVFGAAPARANECPPVTPGSDAASAECLNAEVPTVDADGQPIPYVEEITAPPEGTALIAGDD